MMDLEEFPVKSNTRLGVVKSVNRPRDYSTSGVVVTVFGLLLIGQIVFNTIIEKSVIPQAAEPRARVICTPNVVNVNNIEYHSDHPYYSRLKTLGAVLRPFINEQHIDLCFEDWRNEIQFNYCLPISGRKDTKFCAKADRMDLLTLQSPICYASVLHMLLVETYEELQATENAPFLVFGSLLGAVRDQAMIPFTEDADIGFVHELKNAEELQNSLWQKGYHMFFLDIWRVCVAPTHPLAGHLYDPSLSISKDFGVPYLDLYPMKLQDDGGWDLKELNNTNGSSTVPNNRVRPFSKVMLNGMKFDTVHDPEYLLEQAYGSDYMIPKPRTSTNST